MPTLSESSASDLSPKFALLGVLFFQPMHGYELHRYLEANLREVWRISQSQVYATLKRLQKDGLISAETQPQVDRPDRACFSLTSRGRAQFEVWLNTPTPGSMRAMRVEFLTRLFFAGRMGLETCARLLQEQAGAIRADLERMQARVEAIPPDQAFNHLGLELRLNHLESTLEWLESCDPKRFL